MTRRPTRYRDGTDLMTRQAATRQAATRQEVTRQAVTRQAVTRQAVTRQAVTCSVTRLTMKPGVSLVTS
jgi:hypothetical protein